MLIMKIIRMSSMRISGLLCLWVLVSSCGDIFSTKPITPKPEDINRYNSLFMQKEKILYKMEEWVIHDEPDSIQVTNQKVEFKFLEEIEIDSKTWSLFDMRVTDFKTGDNLYSKTFRGRLDSEGVRFFTRFQCKRTAVFFIEIRWEKFWKSRWVWNFTTPLVIWESIEFCERCFIIWQKNCGSWHSEISQPAWRSLVDKWNGFLWESANCNVNLYLWRIRIIELHSNLYRVWTQK